MAQLERRKKLDSPKSPKSQTSPASDHLLRVEEAYWATNQSPHDRSTKLSTHDRASCHEHLHEECPSACPSHNKKSVIAKVKETAKKLKYSLSGRRKHIELHHDDHHHHHHSHNHDDNHSQLHDHITPCWTATLEDDYLDERDEDPEYLGAPMYESEAAPECLKETARQHPRAVPVVSESHRVPDMTKHEAVLQENDKNVIANITQSVTDKLAPACAAVSDATHQVNANMMANVTGTVSEKLAPACAVVSDATHQITDKLAGIAVTSPKMRQQAHERLGCSGQVVNLSHQDAEVKRMREDAGNLMQCTSGSPQTWDKGVSVKEYFLHKLEPGEDERALSQAITEAISPRKSSGDTGVVDKVKGAVSSLFWQEDASNSTEKPEGSSPAALATSDIPRTVQFNHVDSIHTEKPAHPSPSNSPLNAQLNRVPSVHVRSSKIRSTDTIASPLIPLSSNPLEDYEEENHGKILQTN